MREIKWPLLALTVACSSLRADVAFFSMSQAQVTPDTHYGLSEFSGKWPHIGLDEAKRLHGLPEVVFVDGRNYGEWEASHIPGALPLPGGEFDKRYAQQRAKLIKAKIIVTYCHGETCGLADQLAQMLTDKGHHNTAVFWGGFPAWKKAKLPLEGKSVSPHKKVP